MEVVLAGELMPAPIALEHAVEFCKITLQLVNDTVIDENIRVVVSPDKDDPDYDEKRASLVHEIRAILHEYLRWQRHWPWSVIDGTTTLNEAAPRCPDFECCTVRYAVDTMQYLAHRLYCGIMGKFFPERYPQNVLNLRCQFRVGPEELPQLVEDMKAKLLDLEEIRAKYAYWLLYWRGGVSGGVYVSGPSPTLT